MSRAHTPGFWQLTSSITAVRGPKVEGTLKARDHCRVSARCQGTMIIFTAYTNTQSPCVQPHTSVDIQGAYNGTTESTRPILSSYWRCRICFQNTERAAQSRLRWWGMNVTNTNTMAECGCGGFEVHRWRASLFSSAPKLTRRRTNAERRANVCRRPRV